MWQNNEDDDMQNPSIRRYATQAIHIHDRYAALTTVTWILAWVISIGICRGLANMGWWTCTALAFAIGALGIAALIAYKTSLHQQAQEPHSPTYQIRVNAVPVGTITAACMAENLNRVMEDNTVCMTQITNIAKAARRLTADILVWLAVSASCAAILYILLAPDQLVRILTAALAMKPLELQQASAHLLGIVQAYIGFLIIARIWMGPSLGLVNIYRQQWHNRLRVHIQCPANGEMTLQRCQPDSDCHYSQHAV